MFQGLLLRPMALEAQLPVSDPAVVLPPGITEEMLSCGLGVRTVWLFLTRGRPWALECMTSCA